MKKYCLILLSVLFVIFLSSCQSESKNKPSVDTDPSPYIGVRSLDQLSEMRSMIVEKDDIKLAQYLRGVEGGGAESRDDLIAFINLIDSVPMINLIDGDITWIAHYYNIDSSGEKTNGTLYVSTVSDNGDWTRIEYKLFETDINTEIEKMRTDERNLDEENTDSFTSDDGKIKVYYQTKKEHPSGTGDMYEWIASIDEKIAHVVYFTTDSNDIIASDFFGEIKIGPVLN